MQPIKPARRQFIRDLGLATLVLGSGAGLSGCVGSDSDGDSTKASFVHGVASGDPLADRVILWTRVSDITRTVDVAWEVSTDDRFSTVVASGTANAAEAGDFTVKVDATGLAAGQSYYFRFKCGSVTSPVGRTRTLPAGDVSQVRLAVFSCSNYPAGYFHAYADVAARDDIDAVVHLGDYIYEYERGGYASADAEALGRLVEPAGELLTLDDYRRRHAQYRTDPDLLALHARAPFIVVWDDHEVANDTWKEGAENHDPATEGAFTERRAAAIRAFNEWLPVRTADAANPERIYRSFDFGSLVSLHMLDTRIIGRDRQLAYADFMNPDGSLDTTAFGAAMADPARQLLGTEQSAWLQGQLAASPALWQVLGQQVVMGRMWLPAPIATQAIGFGAYAALAAQAQTAPETLTAEQLAMLSQPSIPYNLDAWDGYAVARETVLGMARAYDKNLVVLSGDTHNAWANDLQDSDGNQVGVEFATTSVSSPGLEEYITDDPAVVAAGVVQIVEPLKYANTSERGYMLVTATATACEAEWHFVSSVKTPGFTSRLEKTLGVLPGSGNRRLVEV